VGAIAMGTELSADKDQTMIWSQAEPSRSRHCSHLVSLDRAFRCAPVGGVSANLGRNQDDRNTWYGYCLFLALLGLRLRAATIDEIFPGARFSEADASELEGEPAASVYQDGSTFVILLTNDVVRIPAYSGKLINMVGST
jgi:hypothetical protein